MPGSRRGDDLRRCSVRHGARALPWPRSAGSSSRFGPARDLRRTPVHLGHGRHGGNRRPGRWHDGHYRVPVSIMYPDAIRTALASSTWSTRRILALSDETAPIGQAKIYYTGDVIFSDYLRREGFTYISVQWARMVTEVLGPITASSRTARMAGRSSRTPLGSSQSRRLGGRSSVRPQRRCPRDRARVFADGIALDGVVRSGHNREPGWHAGLRRDHGRGHRLLYCL